MGIRSNRYLLLVMLLLLTVCSFVACTPYTTCKPATIIPSTKSADAAPSTPIEKPQPAAYIEGKVTEIIDGHTIEVEIDGITSPVRYIGIDTVLVYTCNKPLEWCSQESYEQNSKLAAGKPVRLEKDVSEKDRFGNLLRYVWVGDSMINAELVRTGYAQALGLPPDINTMTCFWTCSRKPSLKEGVCGIPTIPQ